MTDVSDIHSIPKSNIRNIWKARENYVQSSDHPNFAKSKLSRERPIMTSLSLVFITVQRCSYPLNYIMYLGNKLFL